MSREPGKGFEPWAWLAFGLVGVTVGLFVFLGFRPGGAAPVLVYRWAIPWAGWACAVTMLLGLLWCLRRRPLLQRGRTWPLAALGAGLWFCALPIAYPSSHEGRYSTTRFRLPFEGQARVRCGGERVTRNPLLLEPARRFGTGFERTREALFVVAPAAGVLLERGEGRAGEILVLETAAGEYCVLEGLEAGSCSVPPGDAVSRGEALGRAPGVLYVHLQDQPRPGSGEGIPMRYFGYLADGRVAHAGVPIPPQEVANDPAGVIREPGGR